jgi:hypothetical protein
VPTFLVGSNSAMCSLGLSEISCVYGDSTPAREREGSRGDEHGNKFYCLEGDACGDL